MIFLGIFSIYSIISQNEQRSCNRLSVGGGAGAGDIIFLGAE
jgi:hypothetical protein